MTPDTPYQTPYQRGGVRRQGARGALYYQVAKWLGDTDEGEPVRPNRHMRRRAAALARRGIY